jgi:hypothetical protein
MNYCSAMLTISCQYAMIYLSKTDRKKPKDGGTNERGNNNERCQSVRGSGHPGPDKHVLHWRHQGVNSWEAMTSFRS